MFIRLEIIEDRCAQAGLCRVCIESCPVDIFHLVEGKVSINHENEDECTLCDLCLTKCPTQALTLTKLY